MLEHMRDVPVTFDGGDIDDHGHWYGSEMGCLSCHETAHIHCGITPTYLLASLNCSACGEAIAEYWI